MAGSFRERLLSGREKLRRTLARTLAPQRDRVVRELVGNRRLAPIATALAKRLWCDVTVLEPLTVATAGRAVCAFSHFDAHGIVDAHVFHHLAALHAAGVVVVFVSTAPSLGSADLERLRGCCAAIVRRENRGLDFGSWRTALLLYPALLDAELLLLANDSVYGPLHDLRTVLVRMARTGCDFWGITESLQMQPHFQSYFLGFHRTALVSAAFRRFLDDIELLDDKEEIISRYEVGMRARLSEAGLSGMALVPAHHDQTVAENPTLHRWREVVAAGSPYLKVQLLRENPHRQPIEDWPDLVRARGLDPSLVQHHLTRTTTRSATLTPSRPAR